MPLKTHRPAVTKGANYKLKRKKHLANPANFQDALRTYGLSKKGFAQVKVYIEERLGHALAK